MSHRVKVVFVTPHWGKPRTGPEVYAKYLWEFFRDDPDVEFHLVAGGTGESHPRLHLAEPSHGSLSLYRSVARRALDLIQQLGSAGILHVNNSNFHQLLLRSPWPIIGQINDYESAQFHINAISTLRRDGLRRVLSLWRRNFLERKFVRTQAITLCNSEFTRRQICSAYGVNGRGIRVAYKAVDVERFVPPASSRRGSVCGNGMKTVIFIGSNFRVKGLDVLVKSMRFLCSPVKLIAVGVEFAEFEANFPGLIASAEKVGMQIEFLGPVEREKIPPLLWSADAFCLPSRTEALGVALLEAVAAGLPCVASNVGGIPEIARYFESVTLVPPNNVRALASALDAALSKPVPAVPIGEIGRIFGRETMIRGIKNLYLELST